MASDTNYKAAVAVSVPLEDEKIYFVEEVKQLLVNGHSTGSGKLYITNSRAIFVMNDNIMERSAEEQVMTDSPASRGRGFDIRFHELTNFSFLMKGASTVESSPRDASDAPEAPARIILIAEGKNSEEEAWRNRYVFEFGSNEPVDLAYEALVMRSENAKNKNLEGDTFAINVHCFPKDLQCDMCKFYTL